MLKNKIKILFSILAISFSMSWLSAMEETEGEVFCPRSFHALYAKICLNPEAVTTLRLRRDLIKEKESENAFGCLFHFKSLKKLETCFLKVSSEMVDVLLESLEYLISLEELELGPCSSEDTNRFLAGCTCFQFRKLHVEDITDIGLASLLKGSRSSLECLRTYAYVSTKITDSGFKYLAEFTSLKYLIFCGRTKAITDLGLRYLANGKLKNSLELLNLRQCSSITTVGLSYLINNCPNLRRLVVSEKIQGIEDFIKDIKVKKPDLEIKC